MKIAYRLMHERDGLRKAGRPIGALLQRQILTVPASDTNAPDNVRASPRSRIDFLLGCTKDL